MSFLVASLSYSRTFEDLYSDEQNCPDYIFKKVYDYCSVYSTPPSVADFANGVQNGTYAVDELFYEASRTSGRQTFLTSYVERLQSAIDYYHLMEFGDTGEGRYPEKLDDADCGYASEANPLFGNVLSPPEDGSVSYKVYKLNHHVYALTTVLKQFNPNSAYNPKTDPIDLSYTLGDSGILCYQELRYVPSRGRVY